MLYCAYLYVICLLKSTLCFWDLFMLMHVTLIIHLTFHSGNIPQFIYLFFCWWSFRLFPIFLYYTQWYCEHSLNVSLCICTRVSLGSILRNVTAGLQDIHIFNLIRFCQIALQSGGANLHLRQKCTRDPISPGAHQHWVLLDVLITANLMRVKLYCTVNLNSISLIINEIE